MYLNPSTSPNNSDFKDKTLNSWLHWPRKPSRSGFCLVLPPHLPPSALSPSAPATLAFLGPQLHSQPFQLSFPLPELTAPIFMQLAPSGTQASCREAGCDHLPAPCQSRCCRAGAIGLLPRKTVWERDGLQQRSLYGVEPGQRWGLCPTWSPGQEWQKKRSSKGAYEDTERCPSKYNNNKETNK